ncbi:MAG: putative phosphohistidine phosphatase, SixA [Gemmatimonadetes bacterium]|nr:putative phosphohistidine phosphatase, SixA [Gemmatimonadota bacterium]
MQLLVIRHGIAEDQEAFARTGKDDSLRPLTKSGKREMRFVATGLKRVAPKMAVLASSRLVRAQQTAAIIAAEYSIDDVTELDALAPDARPTALLKWLRALDEELYASGPVAVVGHEPHLSGLVTWLLTGQTESRLVLKKGGACRVDFAARPAAGKGELRWLMTPAQLRLIGD